MPIDPSIVLGVRQPNIQQQDPLESYGRSLTLQNLLRQGDLQELQYGQAQRGVADEESLRGAYREAGGDSKVLRSLLQSRGLHKPLQDLDKFELERDAKRASIGKDNAAAGKSNFDVQMKKLEHGAALLSEAKDPQSFDAVLRAGEIAGTFAPEFVAQVRQQGYSPQLIQSLQAAGLTRAQQLADERTRAAQAETGRHNLATEGNTVRGQNITRDTTIRGQNMTQGTAIRGQNLTNDRAIETRDAGRWTNDLARGIQVNMSTGETRPITSGGAPIAPKDDAPEAMLKAAGYADRMKKASALLDQFAAEGKPGFIEAIAGNRAGGIPANVSRSPERQQFHQAAEDWVRAKLRQESGAVIADEEMAREIRTYFPIIGDEPPVVAQKAKARKIAEQAMVTAQGRAKSATGATGGWTVTPVR